ncbi:hypothetical protein QYE76_047011 [Lolium multiflorum]|uniref:DUF4220 domain-containing protein n=1 Tax=Lolium multiflorum TaxID=4521 RepID=A0AAD8X1K3_LOLMU|nr:hypothetical protein QYE76_047011 [Lolium multiflorum]
MRRLGPVHSVLHATINLGAQVEIGSNNTEQTKTPSYWGKIWNERDIQVMVLLSLALQLFLLFAGNVRRRRRVVWLRTLVWLAYLAAYAVAVFAIGLFSQYENKYKLRSLESFEHLHTLTMPFLWAPFLLLHLGGPDTITAFSIEDNNLWTRQLINLAFQLSLALYVFWKSFDLLDSQLLAVAVPLFVAGIIKYGERIWALKSGSRDGLDCGTKKKAPLREPPFGDGTRVEPPPSATVESWHKSGSRDSFDYRTMKEGQHPLGDGTRVDPPPGTAVETRALKTALLCRGLLVGRTLKQLGGSGAAIEVIEALKRSDPTEVKLEFVLTELGMIYDMLYTKAMVLQSWTGIMVRCVTLVAIVVAFVLFWVNQHLHAHRTTNAAITYTLFVAAISVEVYSIFMLIASPWTRARTKGSTVLCWLSHKLVYCFPSQRLATPSMGQFNLTDYSLSKKSTPKFISMASEALGLDEFWRNFWHVNYVEDHNILDYIMGLFNTDPEYGFREQSQLLHRDNVYRLKSLLELPFEYALVCLHMFTDIHLSALVGGGSEDGKLRTLVAECRKLSQYVMYLMAVYPSMLSIDITTEDLFFRNDGIAQDLPSLLGEWVKREHDNKEKADVLHKYAEELTRQGIGTSSPFESVRSEQSLMEMKEVWARLLIYAAGKFRIELHARQLGNGVELLTVVGTLMIHSGLGNMGKKIKLSASTETSMSIMPAEKSVYAFEFLENQDHKLYVLPWKSLDMHGAP